MYKRGDYIPIRSVRNKYNEEFQVLDLLSARYINSLKRLPAIRNHIVEIQDEGRLDRISLQHYKRDDLWFAIAMYNGIIDVLEEVVVGAVLRIPDITQVESSLSSANTKQVTSNSTLTLK